MGKAVLGGERESSVGESGRLLELVPVGVARESHRQGVAGGRVVAHPLCQLQTPFDPIETLIQEAHASQQPRHVAEAQHCGVSASRVGDPVVPARVVMLDHRLPAG